MQSEYPRSHMTRTMLLDGLIVVIGLFMLSMPFIGYFVHHDPHFYPADVDTTSHVALGALIATLAVFRVLVAYGSLWVEVCLFVLGLLVFSLPRIMVMQWHHEYNTTHMLAGGAVMALSVISGLMTIPVSWT